MARNRETGVSYARGAEGAKARVREKEGRRGGARALSGFVRTYGESLAP